MKVFSAVARLRANKSGATVVEYVLIIAGLTLAAVALMMSLGGQPNSTEGKKSPEVQTAPAKKN